MVLVVLTISQFSGDTIVYTSTLSHNSNLTTSYVSEAEILAAGGVLRCWDRMDVTRPHLAQMALDSIATPASG